MMSKKNKTLSENEKKLFEYEKQYWFVSSVIITMLPFVFIFFNGLLKFSVDLYILFGRGELIFASFTLLPPVIFELYEAKRSKEKAMFRLFASSIILAFIHIYLYSSVKIDASYNPNYIIWFSAILFLTTFIFSNNAKNTILYVHFGRQRRGTEE